MVVGSGNRASRASLDRTAEGGCPYIFHNAAIIPSIPFGKGLHATIRRLLLICALTSPLTFAADEVYSCGVRSPVQPDRARLGDQVPRRSPIRLICASTCSGLSARPHHVGSPYDKDNAEWILAQFKEWGLDAHIETFDVLFPTPKERAAGDDRSRRSSRPSWRSPRWRWIRPRIRKREQLPTYNAYSIDGDVTAPLVFVNYGMPGRLREARAARHFGEGRDRDRASTATPGAASSRRSRPSTARSAA